MLKKIIPFIFVGITLVVFFFAILFFSSLLLVGALLGFVLFVIVSIKDKFFPKKKEIKPYHANYSNKSKTYDHDS